MNRTQTTKFLSDMLISQRLSDRKYYASEVSIDYGTQDVKRIDFLQFEPLGVANVAEIEKGIFICYEVKSCKADFKSGFGQNFLGEKNYFVMPMETYKQVVNEIPHQVGCIIPIPFGKDKFDEFENPTPLSENINWELKIVKSSIKANRKRSMIELMFCMLRSGK